MLQTSWIYKDWRTEHVRNIVCISGTSRPGNFTSKALGVVINELDNLKESHTVFDARELKLDFPGNPPTADAERLTDAVADAAGVILASPEYHGAFSAMTKLILENMGFPSALAGKPVALVGVAAGRIGAIKSLEQLKNVCSHIGAIVVPGPVSIAGVQSVFDNEGNVLDAGSEQALRGVATAMHEFLNDYICPKYMLEEMVRQDGHPWAATL
jgi:NAD(P)H-dependent FMN reductase